MKSVRWLGMVLVAALWVLGVEPVQARRPRWGGHGAVAVSPDGSLIAVGGAGRTLYVLDAESMEVTRRIWQGVQIGALAFNADGTRLAVEDETGAIVLFETEGFSQARNLPDADMMFAATPANRMAVISARGSRASVLCMTTGDEIRAVAMPEGVRAGIVALNRGGTRLAALSLPFADADADRGDPPEDMPQNDARMFGDGNSSRLLVWNVEDGAAARDHTLWYTPSGDSSALAWSGDDLIVFGHRSVGLRIGADGTTTRLDGMGHHMYGRGSSADHALVVMGGLANGSINRITPEGVEAVAFRIADRLRGWPEYFADFAFGPENRQVYGVTSASRLIRMSPGGRVEQSVPVY